MLKRIYNVLFPEPGTGQTESEPDRLPLATCVVLLEAARIDEDFTEAERRHILHIMRNRFKLSHEEAEEMLEEANDVSEESTDLWRFTHEINQHYSQEEKIQIMDEVWRLVLSDGTLGGMEDHLVHKLRNLLNLNHPQMIDSKMKVLKEVRGE